MKEKKSAFPSKLIFMVMIVVCIMILFFSYATGFSGGALGKVANHVFVPVQKGMSVVADRLIKNDSDRMEREELIAENEALKAQIEELTITLNNNLIAQSELDSLKKLNKLSKEYNNYKTTGASIIAKGSSNWFNTFTIDKGSDDGLKVNMNVLADGGLVGIITECGSNFSVVSCIIDDDINVSATMLSTNDNCIVSGSLKDMAEYGSVQFSDLDDDYDIVAVGDSVVTSNISDKYVPGILIGYITEINEDDNGLTKSGKVTPAVDFKHLDNVLVILDLKEAL